MNTVIIASSEADAAASEAIEQHHAQLLGVLAIRVEALLVAASRPDTVAADAARTDLLAWCEHELMPHVRAEEQALYPAARGRNEGRLVVDGLLAEHEMVTVLVRELAEANDMVRAAATAKALQVLFDSHQAKENELVLPLLVAAVDVAVADLLTDMQELLSESAHVSEAPHSGGGHSCSCGEVDGPDYPELDARSVPHAIRHATIFGALDSVQSGSGMILVAPHDPLPLLAQLEQRSPGIFQIDYLEQGPEAWRLSFVRRVAR